MSHPNVFQDILELHEAYEAVIPAYPTMPDDKTQALRKDLITEEFVELMTILRTDDFVNIAKEAVDLIVVILGTLVSYGIDFDPVWQAVYKTNMEKANGPVRADNKRLKPKGWKSPDIDTLLRNQRSILLTVCPKCMKLVPRLGAHSCYDASDRPLAQEIKCPKCGDIVQYPYEHKCKE